MHEFPTPPQVENINQRLSAWLVGKNEAERINLWYTILDSWPETDSDSPLSEFQTYEAIAILCGFDFTEKQRALARDEVLQAYREQGKDHPLIQMINSSDIDGLTDYTPHVSIRPFLLLMTERDEAFWTDFSTEVRAHLVAVMNEVLPGQILIDLLGEEEEIGSIVTAA